MSTVPIVSSAAELPAAIRLANRTPSSRAYVARRAAALGEAGRIPAAWGLTPAITAAGWDPGLHPRDRNGKFIEKFGILNLFDGAGYDSPSAQGRVIGNKSVLVSGKGKKTYITVEMTSDGKVNGAPHKKGDEIDVDPKTVETADKAKAKLPGAPASDKPDKVAPGDIVREKASGAEFEVTKVNDDGSVTTDDDNVFMPGDFDMAKRKARPGDDEEEVETYAPGGAETEAKYAAGDILRDGEGDMWEVEAWDPETQTISAFRAGNRNATAELNPDDVAMAKRKSRTGTVSKEGPSKLPKQTLEERTIKSPKVNTPGANQPKLDAASSVTLDKELRDSLEALGIDPDAEPDADASGVSGVSDEELDAALGELHAAWEDSGEAEEGDRTFGEWLDESLGHVEENDESEWGIADRAPAEQRDAAVARMEADDEGGVEELDEEEGDDWVDEDEPFADDSGVTPADDDAAQSAYANAQNNDQLIEAYVANNDLGENLDALESEGYEREELRKVLAEFDDMSKQEADSAIDDWLAENGAPDGFDENFADGDTIDDGMTKQPTPVTSLPVGDPTNAKIYDTAINDTLDPAARLEAVNKLDERGVTYRKGLREEIEAAVGAPAGSDGGLTPSGLNRAKTQSRYEGMDAEDRAEERSAQRDVLNNSSDSDAKARAADRLDILESVMADNGELEGGTAKPPSVDPASQDSFNEDEDEPTGPDTEGLASLAGYDTPELQSEWRQGEADPDNDIDYAKAVLSEALGYQETNLDDEDGGAQDDDLDAYMMMTKKQIEAGVDGPARVAADELREFLVNDLRGGYAEDDELPNPPSGSENDGFMPADSSSGYPEGEEYIAYEAAALDAAREAGMTDEQINEAFDGDIEAAFAEDMAEGVDPAVAGTNWAAANMTSDVEEPDELEEMPEAQESALQAVADAEDPGFMTDVRSIADGLESGSDNPSDYYPEEYDRWIAAADAAEDTELADKLRGWSEGAGTPDTGATDTPGAPVDLDMSGGKSNDDIRLEQLRAQLKEPGNTDEDNASIQSKIDAILNPEGAASESWTAPEIDVDGRDTLEIIANTDKGVEDALAAYDAEPNAENWTKLEAAVKDKGVFDGADYPDDWSLESELAGTGNTDNPDGTDNLPVESATSTPQSKAALLSLSNSAVNKGLDVDVYSVFNAALAKEPADAHKDVAKLMTELKLGGKQRKRIRELLDQHFGTGSDSSAGTQAAEVAENLSDDNPVKSALAAKAAAILDGILADNDAAFKAAQVGIDNQIALDTAPSDDNDPLANKGDKFNTEPVIALEDDNHFSIAGIDFRRQTDGTWFDGDGSPGVRKDIAERLEAEWTARQASKPAEAPEAPKATLTDAEKLANAAEMYGTDSGQYKMALGKWGVKPAPGAVSPAPADTDAWNGPAPAPGATVYVHPMGARVYVNADGSMEAYGKDGKTKKTSATPEKLAAGHGQWKAMDNVSSSGSAGTVATAPEVGITQSPTGGVSVGQLPKGVPPKKADGPAISDAGAWGASNTLASNLAEMGYEDPDGPWSSYATPSGAFEIVYMRRDSIEADLAAGDKNVTFKIPGGSEMSMTADDARQMLAALDTYGGASEAAKAVSGKA